MRRCMDQGFTLIELVIVLVVLSVLISIALPRFVDLRTGAVDVVRKANANSVKSAFAIYIADNRTFPTVNSLADYVQGGTAVAGGIQVSIDGTNYTVPTFSDAVCSGQTTNSTETVKCIGDSAS